MENPFEAILAKLESIEKMLREITDTKHEAPNGEKRLSITEAAEFLGDGLGVIHLLIQSGELDFIVEDNSICFLESELVKYIKDGKRGFNNMVDKMAIDSVGLDKDRHTSELPFNLKDFEGKYYKWKGKYCFISTIHSIYFDTNSLMISCDVSFYIDGYADESGYINSCGYIKKTYKTTINVNDVVFFNDHNHTDIFYKYEPNGE